MGSTAAEKAALRREVFVRRAALTAAQRSDAADALTAALLPAALAARRVAAYVSFGTEPATDRLLAALAGRPVLLPVLLPDGDLDWADAAAGLRPGRGRLVEPAGPRLGRDAVAGCDLLVVPALAVDRTGVRLGRGGGAYDRALSRATGDRVALLYDGELVEALPWEPHDAPVTAVVTPSGGLLALRGRPAGGPANRASEDVPRDGCI